MKRIIAALAAAGFATFAVAQSAYMKGDDLQAEIKRVCDEGCIVFSPAEVEALQLAIVRQMAADLERAYQAGKDASDLTCRNKI
jgi:hypothetical protein